MISPEVCDFPAPACSLQFLQGNLRESEKCVMNTMEGHFFNHLVSVILPDTVMVPSDILNDTLSQDCSYYKVLRVPISEFVENNFIGAFVKQGQLTAISINTKLDTDDCACMTPSGLIILSLNKISYEQLGLEGHPSHFCRTKPALRYNVLIDLKATHFKPGKKNYERVQWCLKNANNLKFDIIIAWDPPDDKICPSSVAAYFDSKKYKVEQCEPHFLQRRDMDILVPHLNDCDNEDLLEWLGAYCLQANLSGSSDKYISTYFTPVENETRNKYQIAYLQFTGLFTVKKIKKLLDKLRIYVESRSSLPWVSLCVQGFDDTPVCWDHHEHHYQQSGENSYTIFLQPNLQYLVAQVLGPKRKPHTQSRRKKK